jgi:MSHA pilin protein MshA
MLQTARIYFKGDEVYSRCRGISRTNTAQSRASRFMGVSRGFTLIELIAVIAITGVLAAIALGRYADLSGSARSAAINGLAGSVNSAVSLVIALTAIRGAGTAGSQVGITYVTLADGTQIRVWNGYPDRWCDGIGLTQIGATVPAGGCYLSTAAVASNNFTFYGAGNSTIPNGDAGWRIESAPTPINCAVGYNYGGTGTPTVYAYTSGC